MKITNLFSRVRMLHEEGVEWDHWQASKDNSHASCQRIGDAHVGDGGVSDDGKNGKPPFWDNVSVSILGLLLFEYISICEITLKESL